MKFLYAVLMASIISVVSYKLMGIEFDFFAPNTTMLARLVDFLYFGVVFFVCTIIVSKVFPPDSPAEDKSE